jgi:hypothetical protein
MKLKFVALGALAAGGTVLIACAARWRLATTALVARLRAQAAADHLPGFTYRELDVLPPPVARYFRAVLPDSGAAIRYARLEQRGRFLVRPTLDGWRPFTATEHFTARPAGFVWDARIRMLPGMHVKVRDGFVAGRGSMVGSVMGLRRVVSVADTPAIAAGALQRYLAEAVWLPTALLPSAGVSWAALDSASARATLTSGTTTVSLDFHFGADGLVSRIYTPARERDLGGGRSAPTPWQGRFSRYEARHGFLIPISGEVEWLLPEGPQLYWQGEITGVTFERFPAVFPRSTPAPERVTPSPAIPAAASTAG